MPQETSTAALRGGLNLVTSPIAIPPGMSIANKNYEPDVRGYHRIDGFERYDGRPKPSAAAYWVLPYDQGVLAPAVGDTMTGLTSGATGIVAVIPTATTGTWGVDAAGTFVLRSVTGAFVNDEILDVGGSTRATAAGASVRNGGSDANHMTYVAVAQEAARSAIQAVPGSGPVRGVHLYGDAVYAWRDNAGGTAGVLHKATAAGWVAQTFGYTIDFDTGTWEWVEGDTLTGFTSGRTATIRRAVLEAGTYSGRDADGYLVTTAPSGAFTVGETIHGSTGTEAFLANGADAAATMLRFDVGTAELLVDKMVVGGSSGAKAQITTVVVESGSWALGTAAGYLLVGSVTGSFTDNEALAGRAQATSNGLCRARSRLNYETGAVATFTVGETITGGTSLATGVVTHVVVQSGTHAGGDAQGYVIFSTVTGTFVDLETITGGTSGGTATADGTTTAVMTLAFNNGEGEIKDGETVTGQSTNVVATITDVVTSSGTWAAGTAAGFFLLPVLARKFKQGETIRVTPGAATANGIQTGVRRLNFDEGETEPRIGSVIKGGTSTARGIVAAVYRSSGLFTQANAAGHVLFSSVSGTFQDNETCSVLPTAKATADAVAITLPAGGRYEAVNANFFADAASERMYFVNGVGRAHEWDGTTLAPIRAGGLSVALDKPNHIGFHANHLFLSYARGSLIHSEIGNPLGYLVIQGSGEIGFGNPIVGLMSNASTSLVVFGASKVGYISGSDTSTFRLDTISDAAGAYEWTPELLGVPAYMDAGGLRRLDTTQAYGNWRAGTLTEAVDPLLDNKRKTSVSAVGSMRIRGKDQYRVYYSDGTALAIYLGRKAPEVMALDYGKVFSCFASCTYASGAEILLCGDADGMVYEMDAGTNFDGSAVSFFVRMPFNHIGSPAQKKRYHKVTIELEGTIDTTIGCVADYDYGSADPAVYLADIPVDGGGGFWDETNWNEFFWSATVAATAEAHIDGFGQNISVTVIGRQTYEAPHTLSALTINFSIRRQAR